MRTRLKQCTLFALSFVLFSTAFSTVFSVNAFAADTPTYDDNYMKYQGVRALTEFYFPSKNIACVGSSFSKDDVISYIRQPSNWKNGVTNSQAGIDALNAALDNGSISISMQATNATNYRNADIVVILSATPSTLTWWTNAVVMRGSEIRLQIEGVPLGVDQCSTRVTYNPTVSNRTLSSDGGLIDYANPSQSPPTNLTWHNSYYLSENINVNYPANYDGPPVELGQKIEMRPDFTYEVLNKDITAKDHKKDLPPVEPDDGYTVKSYEIEWTLFSCSSWEGLQSCKDPEVADYQIQEHTTEYKYSVSDYGDYQLEATYLVQQCYRYPSYPATPDHCFYVDMNQDVKGYSFTSTSVRLSINGDSLSGDTRDGECAVNGFCVPPSPYEDCSYEFWDIAAKVGCHIRNFGVYLGTLFKSLFIPSARFFSEYISTFNKFLSDKLGFVYYPITFITEFAQAFSNPQTQCVYQISTTPGYIFNGSPLLINMCQLKSLDSNAWTYIVTIVRGAIVFVQLLLIYRLYLRILEARA